MHVDIRKCICSHEAWEHWEEDGDETPCRECDCTKFVEDPETKWRPDAAPPKEERCREITVFERCCFKTLGHAGEHDWSGLTAPSSDAAQPEALIAQAKQRAVGLDNWADVLEAHEPEGAAKGILMLRAAAKTLRELAHPEDAEWQKSFDLYHDAIHRGTKLWQEATGRIEVLPDTAELVAWLLDLVHRAEDVTQPETIRKAIELLCGRIGGCLGETCGCVKGTLDMKPSSETRRKAAWDYLCTAHPEDAQYKTNRDVVEAVEKLVLKVAHLFEDAPEGPEPDDPEAPYEISQQTDVLWIVRPKLFLNHYVKWRFDGTEVECIVVRNALNRLKGDETDG